MLVQVQRTKSCIVWAGARDVRGLRPYAESPHVADAVIEAETLRTFVRFTPMSLARRQRARFLALALTSQFGVPATFEAK